MKRFKGLFWGLPVLATPTPGLTAAHALQAPVIRDLSLCGGGAGNVVFSDDAIVRCRASFAPITQADLDNDVYGVRYYAAAPDASGTVPEEDEGYTTRESATAEGSFRLQTYRTGSYTQIYGQNESGKSKVQSVTFYRNR